MFVERKIIGRMHGENYRHFDALGGWKYLEYDVSKFCKLLFLSKKNLKPIVVLLSFDITHIVILLLVVLFPSLYFLF